MSFNPPSILLLEFVSFELFDESLTFLSFDKGKSKYFLKKKKKTFHML